MRLILFDIDGTLLTCGSQVAHIFMKALETTYGTCGSLEGYSFAGRTDPGIVLDLMTPTGIPRKEILEHLPSMKRRYLESLGAHLEKKEMRLLPGAVELLEQLSQDKETTLALLTGNWLQGARIKLSHFDLNRFFPFGAFGNDGFDRRDLPPAALQRAHSSTGRKFSPRETLIIGDSVRDVGCGRANGVAVLAVATGTTSEAELEAAGAHWVVPDLTVAAEKMTTFLSEGHPS
ncbi:MAG: HAD hydrolase-like protein [Deltaproteobacteria bacterium]|nr:HAD hydrolase-like protein [Deltaproteobacteria bacterium]